MSTTHIAYMIGTPQQTASYVLRRMLAEKMLVCVHKGPRVIYGFDLEELDERPLKEIIRKGLIEHCTKTGRGATVGDLAVKTGYEANDIFCVLAEMRRKGQVEKVALDESGEHCAYIPNDERYKNGQRIAPYNASNGNLRYEFITKKELAAAKKRVQIGDVFRARYTHDEDEEDRTVIVAMKSKHLIRCLDGETFDYQDLAKYYRHKGNLPLGEWPKPKH